MIPCMCGYEATDDIDLDDHIAYMGMVDDPDDHRERK